MSFVLEKNRESGILLGGSESIALYYYYFKKNSFHINETQSQHKPSTFYNMRLIFF